MLGSISASWEVLHTQAVIAMLLLLLFSGWQPRWFLLCGGILSYYDSPEDAWKGCKGSIQMAVCEIQGEESSNLRVLFFFLFSLKNKKAPGPCIPFSAASIVQTKGHSVMCQKKALQIKPKTVANFYKKIG